MYQFALHNKLLNACEQNNLNLTGKDIEFFSRLMANGASIQELYFTIYHQHPKKDSAFDELINTLIAAYLSRTEALILIDKEKENKGNWFLSNQITGMSLYVDRFCGNLKNVANKLDYFTELGVNFLHLMPLFQSPAGESDGGYAVSDFRKVDERFGTLDDLIALQKKMASEQKYLMLDIVLNHTSHLHEWALKAKAGDPKYQDYFYMYDSRELPDTFEQTMPEIFPESSPGSFTYIKECNKWVMTVFHHYQWDLNYQNPAVFIEMLDTILFYANLGIDIIRIDAPAFLWKQLGTSCQNLPEAHTILQLIKQCVQVVSPGVALLGEAIVAPKEILKYFGSGNYLARECDVAYNATQMALQWDALATGDTRVMLAAQYELLQKPFGTTWINYTRCHDDIGLGYDDSMIAAAGYQAYEHRKYLKDYYSGAIEDSPARGALFSVNPKTQDARISGSLASLCGLEQALSVNDPSFIDTAIKKICLMQAQSLFVGGIPMLFYGDEVGYTNDYLFLNDPGKSYDNRWMHRPTIDWEKNDQRKDTKSMEGRIFNATRKLIELRKNLPMVADYKNIRWITPHNIHIAGFVREWDNKKLFCLFNYQNKASYLTWYAFKEKSATSNKLFDHWSNKKITIGPDYEYLVIEPYGFCLLEAIE